jgi:chitodextrinase
VGDGQSVVVTGGQRAAHDFNNVKLLDVPDLLNSSNHLELVGSWTWAMEKDDVGVAGLADSVASVLKNTLNTIVASGSIPSDTNQLVSSILGNFGTVFNLVAGVLFDSIPGLPDDAIGSNFYIGVGAKGALSDIINATLPSVPFPTVQIPIFTVPPDIGGGHLFSLGNTTNTFPGDIYDQGEGRYAIDMSMNAEPAPNQTPVASFAPSATSGTPPMAVTFNGAGSYDPDGTIVSYNWDFGDFTTGSGAGVGHTFTSAGTFPVTLTVTDNRGGQATKIVNISVGGAPTVAPTGLQKTGSGCCNTYGDFAWNEVPGATAYEINLDGYFGGGCVTDADSVITGQTGVGRVQAFGLCLGSSYNVKIRAQANGQWGPWSPTVNISL